MVTCLRNPSPLPFRRNKHFISQYIKAREGYYFNTLQQEYELTQMMSSGDVA
ncbi:VirB8 family type IV secretion system protein, partial [Aggregatibacter actinomycetemcomitans]